MAKKAAKTKALTENVMEAFAAYSPPWNDDEEVKTEKPDVNQSLVERLAKVEAELEARTRQAAISSFQGERAWPAQGQKVDPAAPAALDPKKLPDPVVDKDAYGAALTQQVQAVIDEKTRQSQAEAAAAMEREQLANNLWAGFRASHPDWAEHEMLVEAAAGRVSAQMAQKGVNVVALMKQQPDLFYNEIASILDASYPQLKGKEDGDEDEKPEEGQVADVFGGQAGGRTAPVADPEAGKGMLRELAEFRHKHNLR